MTAVLGGGISGLTAAYYALENPRLGAITLLEASNRVGGWIRTCQSPSGATFEKGPRTIRNSGPVKNTLEIVENLKLSDKIIPFTSKHPITNNRLIYTKNQLITLPNSLIDLFKIKTPFRRPLITLLWSDWRAPKIEKEDESLYSFISRRLGKDVADYFISSLTCGICAGDAQKLSVNFLMQSQFEGEQKYGSIVKGILNKRREEADKNAKKTQNYLEQLRREANFKKEKAKIAQNGDTQNEIIDTSEKNDIVVEKMSPLVKRSKMEKWIVWTLDGGLEQIPKLLKQYLQSRNVNICLNNVCENITFKPDCVEIQANGQIKKYSNIISSLPAKHLATLVEKQHPELAQELKEIPFVTVGVINLEFPGNVLTIDGFGFLIPPIENIPILGVIYDSCLQPESTSTVLTVMMGGAWFDHYFGHNPTEDYLISVAVEQVKRILNIEQDPVHVHASILKDCIPQHIVGHNKRVERIRNYISSHGMPLALCGSSYKGVGLNDVILSAKNAVDDISQFHQ